MTQGLKHFGNRLWISEFFVFIDVQCYGLLIRDVVICFSYKICANSNMQKIIFVIMIMIMIIVVVIIVIIIIIIVVVVIIIRPSFSNVYITSLFRQPYR